MNRQCPATKRNGDHCRGTVRPGSYHCWAHDPANTGQRQRIASRGGKGNRGRVSKDLHRLLEDLTEQVISGALEPYPAAVAGSLIGVRLKLLEFERKVKEQDDITGRLEALEEARERERERKRGTRWGS